MTLDNMAWLPDGARDTANELTLDALRVRHREH